MANPRRDANGKYVKTFSPQLVQIVPVTSFSSFSIFFALPAYLLMMLKSHFHSHFDCWPQTKKKSCHTENWTNVNFNHFLVVQNLDALHDHLGTLYPGKLTKKIFKTAQLFKQRSFHLRYAGAFFPLYRGARRLADSPLLLGESWIRTHCYRYC